MKKTISATISGSAFMLEEDAYEILKKYIDEIKIRLDDEEGKSDIITDVEYRISELLHEYGAGSIRAVTKEMVDRVIATIGNPAVFEEEETKHSNKIPLPDRKLMRDPRNKVLGGVCSGLGLYFGIDTAIVRIIMLLVLICYGSGIIIYLIMWIVIPNPQTATDYKILDNMTINQKKL